MKIYKVLAESLTTHKGLIFRKGSTISESKLHPDHIPGLLKDKAIELITPEKQAKKEDEKL